MLYKTRGIVIHTIKYSDTSVIAKIYTEKFGLRSYLIRGVRSKKAKIRAAQLQHLNLLNLVVYEKGNDHLIDADRCAILAHHLDTLEAEPGLERSLGVAVGAW